MCPSRPGGEAAACGAEASHLLPLIFHLVLHARREVDRDLTGAGIRHRGRRKLVRHRHEREVDPGTASKSETSLEVCGRVLIAYLIREVPDITTEDIHTYI